MGSSMKKSPMNMLATATELRAVWASGTVRKRISTCGRPTGPRATAMVTGEHVQVGDQATVVVRGDSPVPERGGGFAEERYWVEVEAEEHQEQQQGGPRQ